VRARIRSAEGDAVTACATPELSTIAHAEWIEMLRYVSELDAVERRVALEFLRRLHAGRRAYGPLQRRGRDWLRELQAELIDGAAYIEFELAEVER
jgi:hypothetical protein